MITLGFARGFTLTLQETRCVHDSMNRSKVEFITYIYILIIDIYYKKYLYFRVNNNLILSV